MAGEQDTSACGKAIEELQKARIELIPENAYYIPEFITQHEEEQLLQKITSVPIPRWKYLSRRRLQSWPCALSKSNTLLASPLPQWLISPITSRFTELEVFRNSPHKAPNHVLINEYLPGPRHHASRRRARLLSRSRDCEFGSTDSVRDDLGNGMNSWVDNNNNQLGLHSQRIEFDIAFAVMNEFPDNNVLLTSTPFGAARKTSDKYIAHSAV
ncbi:conserved hypothetical protein [Histoplasma mississippiense (nom. inval.)]|uniref:conserved hypothetical protein n=1 Tax=Ajellomyces capsulatus (strain NAm1 / WU24) TaxID=2059318 RepID=UPI000157CB5A|nr:conserved hypothetical protein [Histoplasma mississippiense (nom. inval.)]EDN10475.1 conserved hypothetical protein [Histoplasma mississippiense (nom. inval.)]